MNADYLGLLRCEIYSFEENVNFREWSIFRALRNVNWKVNTGNLQWRWFMNVRGAGDLQGSVTNALCTGIFGVFFLIWSTVLDLFKASVKFWE